jgi:hypothetical protein
MASSAAKGVSTGRKWIITVVGGVIAGVLTAYFVGWLGPGSEDDPLPGKQAGSPRVQVNPAEIKTTRADIEVRMEVSNATPNNAVDLELTDPRSISTFDASHATGDDGTVEMDIPLRTDGQEIQVGVWALSVRDLATGRTSRVLLTVKR